MLLQMELDNIFEEENFYALTFDEARPELERNMFAYLGIFPLEVGERPQTDGKRIFLEPKKIEFSDEKNELHKNRNMSLYLSDLIHELLHVREGSFLIDPRQFFNTFKNPGLAHAIFNIAEDARIEDNAKAYLKPDDKELLQSSNQYLAAKRKFPEKTQDRFMELYSGEMIVKGKPSQFNPGVAEEEKKTLETKLEEISLNTDGIKNVDDLLKEVIQISQEVYRNDVGASLKVVPKVYDLITKAFPNIEKEFPTENSPYASIQAPQSGKEKKNNGKSQKDKKDKSKIAQSTSEKENEKYLETGQGSKELDQKEIQAKDKEEKQIAYTGYRGDVHDFSAGDKKGNKLENLVEKENKKDEKNETESDTYGVGMTGQGSGKPRKGIVQIITYDHLKKAYVHLEKFRVVEYEKHNSEFLRELFKYDDTRRRLVEHFEMLKPNELQKIRFTEDPDELNMEAVIEVLSYPALRTKAKVYDSHKINERDSATAILLDISGSTGGELKSGKKVIDVEKISAGLIYQALTEIGDRVELYAFSTEDEGRRGITNLYHLTNLENLGGLEPENGNADGVAIRGVTAEMKNLSARDKTLIMISDGKPVATGSGADPVIDTSMAFGETEAQGIRTVYFNVDNHPSHYFSILVKNTTYAQSLRDVEQLPKVISEFVMEYS